MPWASLSIDEVIRGERRLDGESFLTMGYMIRRLIETRGGHQLFTDLADVWQPNRLKGIQVASAHGVPFFTATQAFDIAPVPRKWLAPSKTPSLVRRYVQPGWILVTCSGTVGESTVVHAPHVGIVMSHDLLRVVPREEDYRGFLYFFLRSAQARHMMRSSRYGSIVNHLEAAHLFDIPVPVPSTGMRRELLTRVRDVFRLRDEAHFHSKQAEELYADALGRLIGSRDAYTFSVSSADVFGPRRRLEAHYHNPTANTLVSRILRTGNAVPLSEVTERVFGVSRFKHIYARHGIPYVDSEDLFKVNPELDKFIPEMTKKNPGAYFVRRKWLLMACSGQLYGLNGSVALAGPWHENKIVSNHVVRIVTGPNIRPGYLLVALGHRILGRPAVLRYAFGSEVPEIAPEDLEDFPVARFGPGIEEPIADAAEKAAELRITADRVENEGTRQVEKWLRQDIGVDLDEADFPVVS